MTYKFLTVDVFTEQAFEGAQIAIVPNSDDLSEELMQKIAGEFNLWRTVFISNKSDEKNAFSIRTFNYKKEFDFGGYATIGAIHALAELQLINTSQSENVFTLNENHGEVSCQVNMENGKAVFHQVTAKTRVELDRFTPTIDELGDFLSIKPYHFNVNNYHPLLVASHLPYLFVPVDNFASLSSIQFDYKAWAASSAPATFASAIFLFTASEDEGKPHFHCRLVGPNFSLHEDPPIGAAIPAFSAYLSQFLNNDALSFVAERGAFNGRKSELNVDVLHANDHEVEVKIGGKAILISKGELFI